MPLDDPEEIEFRARDIVIGSVLGVATAIAIIAYLAQSPGSRHRVLLATVCVGWVLVSAGLCLLPRRRLVASRWREPFFLAWSATVVGSIAAGVVIEGRSGTPLLAGFILPMIFAAISYPVLMTAIVAAFMLVSAAAASAVTGQSSENTTFWLMALAFAAVMGVWQARGRERRAVQLADEHGRSQRYLDVAGTMIVVMDAAGSVLQVNRRSCEVLGYREEELVGRDWFELALPADVRTDARAAFTAALNGTVPDDASPESPVVTRAGARRSIAWTSRIVPTGDGVGMLVAGEDVTEQRIAQERVRHMAYHDALTGLANRAKLQEHLIAALARARRSGCSVAVLYIDLDHFKVVNDTLGHAAGDELLRQVATRLSDCCRASDLVARHGGDEFMLLLTDIDGDAVQAARTVAHGLLRTLETPFVMEGQEFEIAASVGVATFPRDASDIPELLKCADGALYQAKGDGRGTIRFPAAERASAAGQLTLSARLRRALARDEFELHYQPVFDVASGRAIAVEALLRWNDPERGMVPPGEFIPGAEDSGLIEPIGDWVVDAVIAQAAAWRALGLTPDIAFNLSPRQLRSPGFADRLLGRFSAAGADVGQFIAEITESAAMADPERTRPLLERLAATGLRLAIDDFGADFSSLARLRDLPVHELKIDRSFLRGVPGDGRAAAIVTAIVALADALELTAVAEGVEDQAQFEFLAAHGCALAQGFHLARPAPAPLVTALLGPDLARR